MIKDKILHYPRLDTVLMVEEKIKKTKKYLGKMELWKKLPRQVQYQTFIFIIDYLEESRKIMITKDKKIVWIFADSLKARKLIRESFSAK